MIVYKPPTSPTEFTEYFSFRWEMLRKPLHLPRGGEQDDIEASSFHMAAFYDDQIIGVGRINIEPDATARIRYMAVQDHYQKQGVGSQLLQELENFARNNNVRICWLYAREEAVTFYSKNDYAIKGESKSELSGLKHERMEKLLA